MKVESPGSNYINGQWIVREDFIKKNPSTGQILGYYPNSTPQEVTDAVSAARTAFQQWRKLSRVKRAEYFDNLAQLIKQEEIALNLRDTISLETGKNLNESHAEVMEALHMCQFAAGSGRTPCGEVIASEISEKDAYVIRKPKGVVAVISPWNFPLAIGSFWCSAPALVEGNCVVHKPSELTPHIAQIMAQLYEQAGFPHGVYNLIHGDGGVGKNLVQHPDVDCILFTGSAEVGKEIRQHCASTWHKSCSCELGSKSAVITFEDGNFDLAVDVSIASAFKLSGQRCVSSGRMLVQRSILEKFINSFADKCKNLRVGNPFEQLPFSPQAYYGPQISEEALAKVQYYNDLTVNDSHCKILLQGAKLHAKDPGNHITPHVYTCEWADKKYLKEEVFGPHVAIIPFDTVDDAIRIYNDTEYGLAVGIVTDNFRTMRKCRDECCAGMIYLNGGSIAAESHTVFGGVKKSGNGWKSAAGTFRAVTEEVAVTVNYDTKLSFPQGMK